jgi:predicted nuclease of predicted toxin-antitoxin system
MKLLANENFPIKSFRILLELGYDIKHVGVENAGISDREVMDFSIREGRIIVTFDSDYGELVFRNGYKPAGVIYLRWREFYPESPGVFIDHLFKTQAIDFDNQFTVIDENRIRQRIIK